MMSQFQVADSWQYENISSAEESVLSESPPSSPTLYSQTNSSNIYKPSISKLGSSNGVVSAVRCSPGVIIGKGAKTLLTAVSNPPVFGVISNTTRNGQLGKAVSFASGHQAMMDDMTDLGIDLAEDSCNLEGFEYLDDLTLDEALYEGVSTWSEEASIKNESSISLSPNQTGVLPLELSGKKIESDCKFLENLGIQIGMESENSPTVFTQGELEEFGVLTVYEDLASNEMEIEDIHDYVRSSNKNQQQTIVILSENEEEEEEEDEEDDFQSQSDSVSQPSSVISISDSDEEHDTQNAVIEALQQGKYKAAEALCPASSPALKQGKAYARILCSGSSSRARQSLPASVVTAAALSMPKPERRGRKPSTASTGKPWMHLKDKNLRKKEQNKTAATKYRQKKKVEQEQFLQQEKVLTSENNELRKKNEELKTEIGIIKNLLRGLYNSKKQKQLKRIGKK